jgi:hypothetical protein
MLRKKRRQGHTSVKQPECLAPETLWLPQKVRTDLEQMRQKEFFRQALTMNLGREVIVGEK